MNNNKNEVLDLDSSPSGNIGYSGQVTVSILAGERLISKKVYHNSGKIELFKFLCSCLAGKYTTYKISGQPIKIKLFYDEIDKSGTVQSTEELSNFIYYNNYDPIIESDDGLKTCSVTFHFIIPNSYLNNNASSTNRICLYSENTNLLADFTLAEAVSIADQNTNLILDWKLTLQNQKIIKGET